MKEIDNENVIKYVDLQETGKNYYIFMELADGGDL